VYIWSVNNRVQTSLIELLCIFYQFIDDGTMKMW